MKYVVTSRGDIDSDKLRDDMISELTNFSFQYCEESPDLVITIGGDGTLLGAFHKYKDRLDRTAFLGVHTGHLGFYADWTPEEIEVLIQSIVSETYQVTEYPLLEIVIQSTKEEKSRFLALNEFTLRSLTSTFVTDVFLRGEHFETFRGDGLCVSTPSGSTAYNKALGGAIIHPSIQAIQLTEMASINNRVFRTIGSPLLLPAAHDLVLQPLNEPHLSISIDQLNFQYKDIEKITCKVAEEKIRFARFRPFPFWKRVKDSFVSD